MIPGAGMSQLEKLRGLTDRLANALASSNMSAQDREKFLPALRGLLVMERIELARLEFRRRA